MAIKKYWNFANEGSVPADFSEIEGGSGAVSIASDHLRIDTGGTTTSDYAAAVLTTALNQSALTVIYGECKFSGATPFPPILVGLMDSSGTPAAMTYANRNAGVRMWHEFQLSTGADQYDRVSTKFKNPSATSYGWIASTSSWDSGAYQTRGYYDDGSYYRFVIIYDGTTSPARARALVYGYTEGAASSLDARGWNINYDSSWVDFDTGSTDIDPFDNDAYVIFGDPSNDQTKTAQVIYDFRRIMIGEIDETNIEEFAFTNKGTTAYPMDYEIFMWLNPMPEDQTLWVGRDYDGHYQDGDDADSPIIARGADDWVKDAHCFFDGTTYWLFYQRRDDADSEADIFVSSTSDILNGAWGSETEISTVDTGETAHTFPWVTKYGGTWYMFYGVDLTGGPPGAEIQYKTTTATNPTSGWSSATTILTVGASTKFDDEYVTQPFLIWHSGTFTGGTWYMLYAGYGGSTWVGGLAKSTTGILGTYTRVDDTNPYIDLEAFSTLLDGTHTDATTVTVDNTGNLTAGDLVYIVDGSFPIEVLSVDSGTTFTPSIEVTAADNLVCESISNNRVSPRFAKRINGYWVVYVTSFGIPAGGCIEVVSAYVATTTDVDIADCTFRQLRVGDSAIDFVIPPTPYNERSNENLGTVWEELSPVIEPTDDSKLPDKIKIIRSNQLPIHQFQL